MIERKSANGMLPNFRYYSASFGNQSEHKVLNWNLIVHLTKDMIGLRTLACKNTKGPEHIMDLMSSNKGTCVSIIDIVIRFCTREQCLFWWEERIKRLRCLYMYI